MKYLTHTLIAGLLVVSTPVFAHEGDAHETVAHEMIAPGNASNALKQSVNAINALVAKGDLSVLHEEIEKAEASIQALQPMRANNPRLDVALKQLSTQLGTLHTNSDKGDKALTNTQVKKVNAALKLVEAQTE